MSFLRRLPLLFYLGLLPLVVMLWAWADSTISWTAWRSCRGQDMERAIATQNSTLILLKNTIEGRDGVSPTSTIYLPETGAFGEVHRLRAPEKGTWFPGVDRKVSKSGDQYPLIIWDRLVLPFWLIVLCYLPPWLLLVWWQARWQSRRRRRKREAEEAECRSS
jgi:hypothetical protein